MQKHNHKETRLAGKSLHIHCDTYPTWTNIQAKMSSKVKTRLFSVHDGGVLKLAGLPKDRTAMLVDQHPRRDVCQTHRDHMFHEGWVKES